MPDRLEFMTPAEFAGLSSDAHHTVWRAHAEGRISSVPASAKSPKGMRLFHRAQAETLLTGTKVNPCAPTR
jgi:hypothetical protein